MAPLGSLREQGRSEGGLSGNKKGLKHGGSRCLYVSNMVCHLADRSQERCFMQCVGFNDDLLRSAMGETE